MKLLADKEFNKKIISLVLPLAVQYFMFNLVSASDALMLGAVGQNELSAVSLAGQVQFILGLFLAAITIGTSIFAAQYWGKGDTVSVEKVFAIALRYSIPVAAVFSFCTAVFPEFIMTLFTDDTVLIEGGAKYLNLASFSYLFSGISQIYLCVMKNIGKAKKSTVIVAVCLIFDALMNAVLILGLFGFQKMGIAGAAISTTIAKLAEVLWAVVALQKNKKVKLRFSFLLHIDKRLHKDFWKYTLPVLGNELVWGIGFTMSSVIMGHLNTDAVAANSVANIVRNLVVCFCMGLGNGGGILIGNELGAGNLETAKQYGSKLCRLSIISGITSGAILLCISPFILSFVKLTDRASDYLMWMLIMCSVYMVGKSVNVMTISGIYCAGGDSKFGFLCDTVIMWCITVPIGLISAFLLELPVPIVYLLINADEMLKLPAVYIHYKKYLWVKDLTVQNEEKTNVIYQNDF